MSGTDLLMDRMTVLRYERSIGRLSEASRTRGASAQEISEYARRIRSWSGFAQEVAIEAAEGGAARGLVEVRGDTPESLLRLGLEDLPMMHTRSHLSMELTPDAYPFNGHGVDPAVLTSLPELLEDPIAVYESPTRPNRLVAVLDEVAGRLSEPFVAVIDPNAPVMGRPGAGESNFILSAYGRHQVAREVPEAIAGGRLLKIDACRLERLLSRCRWHFNEYKVPTTAELKTMLGPGDWDSMAHGGTRWNQMGRNGGRPTRPSA